MSQVVDLSMTSVPPPPSVAIPIGELLQLASEREQQGRLDEALNLIERILASAPNHSGAIHLKGVIAFRQGRQQEAAALMERSIEIGPAQPHFYRNICEVYRVIGRYDEALEAGNKAIQIAPNDPHGLTNLAILHYERGEPDLAIARAAKAVAIDNTLPSAHFELAEGLLLKGEFARGWEEYEWRFKLPGAGMLIPSTDRQQWDGKPIPDGTLLLIADQGFGDGIQFSRYIPWAAERAGTVVLACSRELQPIIAQLPGVKLMFDHWQQCPPFTVYCPLSGLPRLHGTTLDNVPATIPYIKAEPERVARWRDRLDRLTPKGYRRVGLAWAGRPTHNNDRNRSIPLAALKPLHDLERTVFISLQKGAGQGQVGAYLGRAPLVNMGPELTDFRDTMAVLECLDLLVSVDTSVGHLAGALGRPAWIMLPYAPDWRWLMKRTDTPWYPSLRLFRQPAPRRWEPVFKAVAEELARL